MRKYQGEVICRTRDHLGDIEVVEDGLYRSLHFGSDAKQSSMLRHNPTQLTLSYTRALCTALLFTPTPQRILLLGLGGGSLAKFFLHHLPQSHIDVVECREAVVDIAHDYFALPKDERLHIHLGDAGRFIREADPEQFSLYDLIVTDAFLETGIAYAVCGVAFLDACRARLSPRGCLAINLWTEDRHYTDDYLNDLKASFDNQVLRLPVQGKENLIVIATQQTAPRRQLKRLTEVARELETHYAIEFNVLLRSLRKANRLFF